MRLKTMLAAVTVCAAFVLIPTAAVAAPVTGGAGADYGEHVSMHARGDGGFCGQMNPGHHRGFSGFDEHHGHHPTIGQVQSTSTEYERTKR